MSEACIFCNGVGYEIKQTGVENDGTPICETDMCEECNGTGESGNVRK